MALRASTPGWWETSAATRWRRWSRCGRSTPAWPWAAASETRWVWRSRAESRPIVATIGDSTFLHSGIPPLMDAVYNRADITVLMLDNHIIAMTGAGPPRNRDARCGARRRIASTSSSWSAHWASSGSARSIPTTLAEVYQAGPRGDGIQGRGGGDLRTGPACSIRSRSKGPAFEVVAEGCTACQACMNLGCPAIVWGGRTCSRVGTASRSIPPPASAAACACRSVRPTAFGRASSV